MCVSGYVCVCCREEEALVDVFVIEMLVVMIQCLKLAHRDDKALGEQYIYIHVCAGHCRICTLLCVFTFVLLHINCQCVYMYVHTYMTYVHIYSMCFRIQ